MRKISRIFYAAGRALRLAAVSIGLVGLIAGEFALIPGAAVLFLAGAGFNRISGIK